MQRLPTFDSNFFNAFAIVPLTVSVRYQHINQRIDKRKKKSPFDLTGSLPF